MGLPPHGSPGEGLMRFCSCPNPFFPLGNDPRGKRSRGCWQSPRPTAQLCSGKGDKAIGDLRWARGSKERGKGWLRWNIPARPSLTSSSLAAAF